MAIWEAVHDEEGARVKYYSTVNMSINLNVWVDVGEGAWEFNTETERQAREALIKRLAGKVRDYERIIAIEQTRLT